MTTTTETPAEALARIQSTHSKNDAQAVLQFYQAGVELDACIPRETILTAKAWRALGKRIGKGATAQRVYGWRPVKKTDKKTGEEKDGMTPFTSLLFHESQMVDLKAPAGTAPAAWQNPALVKAGTYDENGKVIGKDAGNQITEPTEEAETFEPEIVTISSPQQWEDYLQTLAPADDARLADHAAASFTEYKADQQAPVARRQLAMF